jgi:RNA polymerase sigma-70 factor, ECF subfamily
MSADVVYLPDTPERALDRSDRQSVLPVPKETTSQCPEHFSNPTRQSSSLPDERLIEHVRDGEKEALAQLFRRYARAVRSVALRILKDEAEAEDLVQEVFLFIFRKAALFNPTRGTGASWIIHVAYHRAIDRRRFLNSRGFYSSQQFEEAISPATSECLTEPPRGDSLEEVLGKGSIARFQARLTPEQRETIQLFFFEGYTLREIAELTGRTLVNVRSHFYRGLERMRRYVLPRKSRSK